MEVCIGALHPVERVAVPKPTSKLVARQTLPQWPGRLVVGSILASISVYAFQAAPDRGGRDRHLQLYNLENTNENPSLRVV